MVVTLRFNESAETSGYGPCREGALLESILDMRCMDMLKLMT